MDRDHEETERIPWAMLAEDLDPRRRWALQVAGIAGVVVVVGIVAWVTLRGDSGTTVQLDTETLPVATTMGAIDDVGEESPSAAAEGTAAQPAAQGTTAQPAPELYSEADLMAVVPEAAGIPPLAAIARAEQFVVDFFGLYDDTGLHDALPRPVVGDGGYSWVEWARAVETRETSAGVDVLVAFRTLTEDSAGGYRRMGVRGVWVPVVVSAAGVVIGDLPTPASLPAVATIPDPPPDGEVPLDVASEAAVMLARFGGDAEVLGGEVQADGWRVVGRVTDESGVAWPLVVTVPDP
jgi:hypothetical protein